MKNNKDKGIAALLNKAHNEAPIQQVSERKGSKLEGEKPFTFWINKDLIKKAKEYAFRHDQTLKEIINDALREKLK